MHLGELVFDPCGELGIGGKPRRAFIGAEGLGLPTQGNEDVA